MASRLMSDLHPLLKPLALEHMARCSQAHIDARVICTYRSNAEQDYLYTLGRTVKSHVGPWTAKRPLGAKVTNARAGQSEHNFMEYDLPAALAYDVGVFVFGKYVGDGKSPLWAEVGRLGMDVGLNWYGAPGAVFFELAHFAHPKSKELRGL